MMFQTYSDGAFDAFEGCDYNYKLYDKNNE